MNSLTPEIEERLARLEQQAWRIPRYLRSPFVSNESPAANEVLQWDDTAKKWIPQAVTPTSGEYVTYAANATLSAERVVTAPSSGGVIPVVVRKASDETVNNSNVLQEDDALSLTVAANEVWAFDAFILYTSSTVADFKHGFNVPSGATMWYVTSHVDTSLAGEVIAWSDQSSVVASGGNGTMEIGISLQGVIVASSTPGSVVLTWAQNTAEVSDTKVLANSWLIAHKLA